MFSPIRILVMAHFRATHRHSLGLNIQSSAAYSDFWFFRGLGGVTPVSPRMPAPAGGAGLGGAWPPVDWFTLLYLLELREQDERSRFASDARGIDV